MTTRRDTIVMAAAFAAACTSALPPGAAASADLATAKAAALERTLDASGSARAVGRAYLASRPGEADPVALLEAIEAAGEIGGCLGRRPLDHAALARAVAEAVRDDFLCRRSVKVDGWVLSRTEARLCALATLA